jgi:hypothetical protein
MTGATTGLTGTSAGMTGEFAGLNGLIGGRLLNGITFLDETPTIGMNCSSALEWPIKLTASNVKKSNTLILLLLIYFLQ